VNVLFQNPHLGDGNFNLSDESRLYQPSVCNEKTIRGPLSKMHGKTSRGFGDSKVKGTLHFEEGGNGKSLRYFGTAYIDRKALAD